MRDSGSAPRSAFVFGSVALAVAVANIALMVLNGVSSTRILLLVAMLALLVSQILTVARHRRSRGGSPR